MDKFKTQLSVLIRFCDNNNKVASQPSCSIRRWLDRCYSFFPLFSSIDFKVIRTELKISLLLLVHWCLNPNSTRSFLCLSASLSVISVSVYVSVILSEWLYLNYNHASNISFFIIANFLFHSLLFCIFICFSIFSRTKYIVSEAHFFG